MAYRYFATLRRKFIIADTPGHIQYTRNMVTGASTANLAIILIDARKGVIEQTCRHAFIANLLRIQHVVVAVNKMDLVDFKEERFNEITASFKQFASRLDNLVEMTFIPISALKGDNVVDKSANMPWYQGPTLLYHLETVYVRPDANHVEARFPVQYVIRPMNDEFHDYRGYAGRVGSGIFKEGDEVVVLPSGFKSSIKSVDFFQEKLEEAFPPMSVTIQLEDDIDISRGDMIVKEGNMPEIGQDLDLMVCWMNQRKLMEGGKYALKHTTRDARCVIREIKYKVDINTLHRLENDKEIGMNDIGRISIRTTLPLFYDSYRRNRVTGSLILIDEHTHETVGACMIV